MDGGSKGRSRAGVFGPGSIVSLTSAVIALVALGVSIWTYLSGEERRRRDTAFEVVAKSYDKYYEMVRIELDKWYLTHLFVEPELYPRIRDLIKDAMAAKTEKPEKVELLLQERAAADFIFIFYEQHLDQVAANDPERRFLNETLDYLHGSLLPNPRLVYWWHKSAGGLQASYKRKTQTDWEQHVFAKLDKREPGWCDARGPFDVDVRGDVGSSC